jgi:hypothetical protein
VGSSIVWYSIAVLFVIDSTVVVVVSSRLVSIFCIPLAAHAHDNAILQCLLQAMPTTPLPQRVNSGKGRREKLSLVKGVPQRCTKHCPVQERRLAQHLADRQRGPGVAASTTRIGQARHLHFTCSEHDALYSMRVSTTLRAMLKTVRGSTTGAPSIKAP